MVKSKAKQLRFDSYWRYRTEWGNYKSDKWKSKRQLRQEISDILSYGSFTKEDLKMIKMVASQRGFKEFDLSWQKEY